MIFDEFRESLYKITQIAKSTETDFEQSIYYQFLMIERHQSNEHNYVQYRQFLIIKHLCQITKHLHIFCSSVINGPMK